MKIFLCGILFLALAACNSQPRSDAKGGGTSANDQKIPDEKLQPVLDSLQGHWVFPACVEIKQNKTGETRSYVFAGNKYYFERQVYAWNGRACGRLAQNIPEQGTFKILAYNPAQRIYRLQLGTNRADFFISEKMLRISNWPLTSVQKPEALPYQRNAVAACPNFSGIWQSSPNSIQINQSACEFFSVSGVDGSRAIYLGDGQWWKAYQKNQWTRSTFSATGILVESKTSADGGVTTTQKHFLSATPCGTSTTKPAYVIETYSGASTFPTSCVYYTKL